MTLLDVALASALSGMAARVPCHPLDTIKARLQAAPTTSPSGALPRASKLSNLSRISLRNLYRGFPVVFWGSAPAACLYFTTYEASKEHLPIESPTIKHLAAGLLAETVSCVLYVPIDVIKERMQVNGHYKTTSQAFREVYAKEGIRGFYRAYGATLVSFGPYSALYFAFYEHLKEKSDGTVPLALCAGAAGAGAAFATNPLDLVKLRLQVQRASGVAKSDGLIEFGYSNWLDGVAKIIRREGAATLFKGALFRVAFIAPMSTISMGLYEHFKFSLVS